MASEELSSDMLFEILSHASLETLERCKAAPKACSNMIDEPTFLPLHCQRSNCVFGYFFQSMKPRSSKFVTAMVYDDDHSRRGGAALSINGRWQKHDDMQILASCEQGILVCCQWQSNQNKRYFVCKPATDQWQPLPNPKIRCKIATVAVTIIVVKPQPLYFNIVRLSESRGEYICEIFDSRKWTWEKIEGLILSSDNRINPYHDPGVSVGQSTHWLTSNNNVLKLDINERCFRFLPPLPLSVHCNVSKKLVKYKGGLAFVSLVHDWKTTELWIPEAGEWTRKIVVDMEFLRGTFWTPHLVECCSSDVMLVTTGKGNGALYFNVRDGKFRRLEVPLKNIDLIPPVKIFRFRSDFESVDLKPC